MATNGAAVPAEVPAGEEPEQQQGWPEMIKGLIWRFLIMYFIMSLFKGGAKTPAAPNGTASGPNGQVATTNAVQARNLFARGTMMDVYLYISEHEKMKWEGKADTASSTGMSRTYDFLMPAMSIVRSVAGRQEHVGGGPPQVAGGRKKWGENWVSDVLRMGRKYGKRVLGLSNP